MTCQINLKSHQHTSQTDLFGFLLTHLWTSVSLEMLPVHSEKPNPRCIASPACGPAIISTSLHIVCYCVSGGRGHKKTPKKQDFQINRCPIYVKKWIRKIKIKAKFQISLFFLSLAICYNSSEIFLFWELIAAFPFNPLMPKWQSRMDESKAVIFFTCFNFNKARFLKFRN